MSHMVYGMSLNDEKDFEIGVTNPPQWIKYFGLKIGEKGEVVLIVLVKSIQCRCISLNGYVY